MQISHTVFLATGLEQNFLESQWSLSVLARMILGSGGETELITSDMADWF